MHCYNVPIIEPDLRHQETILKAINTFEYLDAVIEDVFKKIGHRIDKNNSKASELKQRINVVNEKVSKLIASNEAICIYSPNHYPAQKMDAEIPVTFDPKYKFSMKPCEYQLKTPRNIATHSSEEKLQFYHVKSKKEPKRMFPFEKLENEPKKNVKYLDSLLLFNEKSYVFDCVDSKAREGRKSDSSSKHESKSAMGESLLKNRSKKQNQDIFYKPTLNEAPKIEVPVDLPELPGIVTNIHYTGNNSLIGPSLNLSALADQLPTIEDDASPTDGLKGKINIEIPDEIIQKEVKTEIKKSAPPPPPPPPPPQIFENSTDEPDKKPVISKPTSLPQSMDDAHSNLMEAIRNAGGAGKAKLKQRDEVKEKAQPSGQNFLQDLHNKLKMRRKGISGNKENQESKGNVMDTLSSLIPPPMPVEKADTSESNDEEDWE